MAVAVEGREALRKLERVGRDAMRGSALDRLGDLGGEREQQLDQRPLARVQRRALGVDHRRGRRGEALLADLREHRRDPGVRVLHVVDRVLARLLAREVEVEVYRRVVRAREQVPTRRVDADLGDELIERDELPGAL